MSSRPDPLPRLYRWRTNLIQMPILTVITALCGSLSLLVSFVDKKGRMQHRIARFWARAVVWVAGCTADSARSGESAQPSGGCLCIEPHFVHGHAGDLCGAAISVSHPGEEGAVADRVHRMVLGPVRADSDRYRQPARHACRAWAWA